VRRIALGAVAGVALLLVVAQIVLPRIAERRLRASVQRHGAQVERVDVRAFPALKLLRGAADAVRVRIGSAAFTGAGDLAGELARTGNAGRVDASVARLRVGPLVMRDLELRERHGRLDGEASLTRSDLAAAIPVDVGLRPVDEGDGSLVLAATAGPVTVRARLSAEDGTLVIAPDGLLGAFAGLTVFDDPRVRVSGFGARTRPDGFTLTASGRLS
jgi:hypothetical protein